MSELAVPNLGPNATPEDILDAFAAFLSSATINTGDSSVTGQESLLDLASIEHFFVQPKSANDESLFSCSVPSLGLKHDDQPKDAHSSSLEATAASNLARPLKAVGIAELKNLPPTLLDNICKSFMSLVSSRVKSSLVALARQARQQQQGNDAQQHHDLVPLVARMLASTSHPISPTAAVTTFRKPGPALLATNGQCIMPIVLDVVMDLNILGNSMTITMEAPGAIIGHFTTSSSTNVFLALQNVGVMLETPVFLQTMMKTVRDVARKALGLSIQIALAMVGGVDATSDNNKNGESKNQDDRSLPLNIDTDLSKRLQEQQQRKKLKQLQQLQLFNQLKMEYEQRYAGGASQQKQMKHQFERSEQSHPPQNQLKRKKSDQGEPVSPRSVDSYSLPQLDSNNDRSTVELSTALLQLKGGFFTNEDYNSHNDTNKRQRLDEKDNHKNNFNPLLQNSSGDGGGGGGSVSTASIKRMELMQQQRRDAINDIVFSSSGLSKSLSKKELLQQQRREAINDIVLSSASSV